MVSAVPVRRLLVGAMVALAAVMVAGGGGPVDAAGEFTVSPTNLSFPATYVGDTASVDVTITNVSGASQTPNFSGGAPSDPAHFGGSQNCAGKTFAPGDSCTFTYTFEPGTPGAHSTSTTIGIGSDSFSISMAGTALFPFDVAPTTLAFPDTAVGSTSTMPVTITNVSPASQTPNFSGGAPIDPTHFGGSQNCAGKTFAPGDSCTFTYSFTPLAAGPWSTTTTIGVDAESFPIALSGTGTSTTPTTTTTTTTTTTSTSTTSTVDSGTPTTAGATTATAVSAPPVTLAGAVPVVPGPLPAGSTAAVVAQGVVAFDARTFAWEHSTLGTANWPRPFEDSPPLFLANEGPDAVLVSAEGGSRALLDAGEASFVPPGSTGQVGPLFDGAVASGRRITFVAAVGAGSFSPGPGRRDVNLIRGVVLPGDRFDVVSSFPVLVVVTQGVLADATSPGRELPAGTSATLGAGVALRNDGTEPAVVLAAAVGGLVP